MGSVEKSVVENGIQYMKMSNMSKDMTKKGETI